MFFGLAIVDNLRDRNEGRNGGVDTLHRRMEIISILSAKGHMTTRELAWELDVSRRTIMNDITALSFDYPIYTKPGEGGGVLLQKITSLMSTPSRRQNLKRFAGCTENQRGKRKKFYSVSFTSMVRTS